MKDLRIVYAFGYADEYATVVSFLKSKMLAELTAIGKTVSRLETVPTKREVEALLDSGDFNLLIVREELRDERISNGSLKSWSQKYPDLPVILYVHNDKKGGEKLKRLLNTAPFYYNVLYENDLTGSNVMKLLENPRTKEEAICYYGLEQKMEQEEENLSLEAAREESLLVEEPEKTEALTEAENTAGDAVNPSEEDSLLEDLEEAISDFDVLEPDVSECEACAGKVASEKEEGDEKAEEHKVTFDYEEMFSGNELFGNAYTEGTEDLEETSLLKDEEIVAIEDAPKACMSEPEEGEMEMKEQEYLTVVENAGRLPESGKVLRVLDHNTMLMELSQPPVCDAGKTLEDYRLLFVVKGTKGSFVNGKYKVGVKSFEGYAGSLLGRQTVIVEIPEYDLIENKVEGADCSIVCIAQ